MSQLIIVTTPQNSGLGTPLATAFDYTNQNFGELYARAQSSPPPTLQGQSGDVAGMYAYDSTYFYYCFQNYTGNSTIWAQVTQVANIALTEIQNGTSNVAVIGPSANVTVGINGTSNVAVFASTGVYSSGLVSAVGNVKGAYILGNGSQLTGLPATYSDSNVVTLLSAFGSNTISTTGTITSGDIQGGNLLTTGQVSATGNIFSQGNLLTQGIVSAVGDIVTDGYFVGTFLGNITGNFVIPGSNTQVVFNTNGNADAVGGMTYNKDSNTFTVLGVVSSQGNVIAGNITTVGQVSAAGNITGGNVTATNITGTIATASQTNITTVGTLGSLSVSGNVRSGNLQTAGQVSATGNITGGNLSISNINAGGTVVATTLNAATASMSGNVTGGNILSGGQLSGGQLSVTGNVSGNYILGNGSQLTGLSATYGNANVITLLAGFGSNTISTTGNVTAGDFTTVGSVRSGAGISAAGNVDIGGNINGSLTSTFFINNTTNTTGVSTGALQVAGGASINKDLWVVGNIYAGNISGVTANVITVQDPLLYLQPNANVTYPYTYDIGFYSAFTGGTGNTYQHTGLVRDFNDNVWKLFSNAAEPTFGVVTFNASTVYDAFQSGPITSIGAISATGTVTGSGLSVGTGTVTLGNITNANGNAVGNIGSSSNYFNTVFAQATSAQYADLAENYVSDTEYEPGTVVVFGGAAEITTTTQFADVRVAGAISTQPAYLMNTAQAGLPVALRGRIPVKVIGPVDKGDLLVTAGANPGYAISIGHSTSYPLAVFAKSIETNADEGVKIITAVIV